MRIRFGGIGAVEYGCNFLTEVFNVLRSGMGIVIGVIGHGGRCTRCHFPRVSRKSGNAVRLGVRRQRRPGDKVANSARNNRRQPGQRPQGAPFGCGRLRRRREIARGARIGGAFKSSNLSVAAIFAHPYLVSSFVSYNMQSGRWWYPSTSYDPTPENKDFPRVLTFTTVRPGLYPGGYRIEVQKTSRKS